MRTFKRILSLILTCALLSSFIVVAHAVNEPTIKVGSGELKKGETVTVPVSIENISSIGAANIQIKYDTNNLTIDSISQMNGTAMGMFLMGTFVSNPAVGTVAWAGTATYPNPDNILFWITFSAKDSAVNGDYSISIEKIATASCLLGDGAAQVINGVVSAPDTITITGGIDPVTLIPAISGQPASANYTYGDTASALSVTASGPEGSALTYQWYSNTADSNEGGTIINGATGASYTPVLSAFGTTYYYYCVVTNTYNGQTYTATSDAAAVMYSKGDISNLTMTLTETEYGYDGEEKAPVVAVGTLTAGTDYTLSGVQSATDAGDYTITAAGTGNYEGSASAAWKITPAEITTKTNPAMTIYTNGKDFTIGADILNVGTKGNQTPTVEYSLKNGDDVVSLSGTTLRALKAGTATITATITASNHVTKTVDIAVTAANKEDVSDSITFTKKDVPVVYDGEEHPLSEFVNDAVCTKGAVKYLLDGEEITGLSATTITDAGNYTITAVYETDTKYGSQSLTVSIAQKTIDVSAWSWSEETTFTYNGSEKSVALKSSNPDFDKVDIDYTNNAFTAVGNYTAIATLTAKNTNYVLSATSLEKNWTIEKATISFTAAWDYSGTPFTYNGKPQTVSLIGVPDTVNVTYANHTKTNAGTYTATASFEAVDSDNYTVSGGVDPLTWTINKAEVNIPTAAAELKYNGKEQTGVSSVNPELYTVTGGADDDADDYTAEASLNDPDNYKWTGLTGANESAVQDIPWSIAKADGLDLTDSVSLRYSNTAEQTVTAASLHPTAGNITITNVTTDDEDGILSSDATLADDGLSVTYALADGLTADDAGKTAEIIITFDSKNYEESTLTLTVTVIDKEDVSGKIIFEKGSAFYTGDEQTYEEASVSEGLDGTITYSYSPAEVKNAGTYSVTAIYEDADNYGTKTVTFTIRPAILMVSGGTVAEKTYDGSTDATVTDVTFSGLVNGETLTASDYTVIDATFTDANAGTDKTVNFTVALKNTEAAGNYNLYISGGTATGTINRADVAVTVDEIAACTFTGSAILPAVTVRAAGEALPASDYTVTGSNNVNAGTATVRIAPSDTGNYNFGPVEKDFTINKADAPVLANVEANYKYNKTGAQTAAITGVPADAGSVSYTIGAVNNEKGVLTDTTPTVDENGVVSFELAGQSAYADGLTAVIPVTVEMQNYQSATVHVTVTLTNKDTPVVSAQDLTVTYTGKALDNSSIKGTANVGGTWEWVTNPAALINANESGYTATVRFVPNDSDNYEEVDTTIRVIVRKATPTGEPAYTPIKSSGRTLADADLQLGTLPEGGTLIWIDADGNELPGDTKVKDGVPYTWLYTHADAGNYNVLTGSIVLYRESYTPSGVSDASTGKPITVPSDGVNGEIELDTSKARPGETVVITVTPDEGYALGSIVVRDVKGNPVPVTDNGDGTFSFEMPTTTVSVEASFIEAPELPSEPVLPDAPEYSFVDVPAGAWFTDAVNVVVEKGLFTGTSNTTFAPDSNMTRAMLVTVLWRLDGLADAPSTGKFSDVLPGQWYTAAVDWAANQGIVLGISENAFGVNGNITREQLATILYRYAQTMGYDTSAKADLSGYVDAGAINTYAQEAMSWAVAVGLITGTTDNTLDPVGNATRAQVAVILMRYMENFVA